MDWDTIRPELQKKLDPRHVRPAPRGKYGDYVDGYHVISEANRIFGEEGWSYEITRLEMVSEQTVDTPKGPQYRVGYLCTVKVHVNDTSFKEGAAVGSGVGNPETIADHHESAAKEAETDALKRALRSYGNTFGLALYDAEKANVGVDLPPLDTVAVRDRIKRKVESAESLCELRHVWTLESDDLARLKKDDPPKFLELNKAKDDQKAHLGVTEANQGADQ